MPPKKRPPSSPKHAKQVQAKKKKQDGTTPKKTAGGPKTKPKTEPHDNDDGYIFADDFRTCFAEALEKDETLIGFIIETIKNFDNENGNDALLQPEKVAELWNKLCEHEKLSRNKNNKRCLQLLARYGSSLYTLLEQYKTNGPHVSAQTKIGKMAKLQKMAGHLLWIVQYGYKFEKLPDATFKDEYLCHYGCASKYDDERSTDKTNKCTATNLRMMVAETTGSTASFNDFGGQKWKGKKDKKKKADTKKDNAEEDIKPDTEQEKQFKRDNVLMFLFAQRLVRALFHGAFQEWKGNQFPLECIMDADIGEWSRKLNTDCKNYGLTKQPLKIRGEDQNHKQAIPWGEWAFLGMTWPPFNQYKKPEYDDDDKNMVVYKWRELLTFIDSDGNKLEDKKGKKVEKDSDSDAYEAAQKRVQNIVKHQFWRDDQIAKLDKGESVHFWCPCTDAALVGGKKNIVDWNLLHQNPPATADNVARVPPPNNEDRDDDHSNTPKRNKYRRSCGAPIRFEPGGSDTKANLKDDKTS